MNAAVPRPLDRIVVRCLQKDPGHRFQTAAELRSALETIGPDARVPRLAWRRWLVAAFVVLLAGAVATLV